MGYNNENVKVGVLWKVEYRQGWGIVKGGVLLSVGVKSRLGIVGWGYCQGLGIIKVGYCRGHHLYFRIYYDS